MEKTIQHQILEEKANLRRQYDEIAQEAQDLSSALYHLAHIVGRASSSGGVAVLHLFEGADFKRDNLCEGMLGVPAWKLTHAFEEVDSTQEFLKDLYDAEYDELEQEKEAAAAAIHAGLKNED